MKKVLSIVMLFAASLAFADSYLYWMVDEEAASAYSDWTSARVVLCDEQGAYVDVLTLSSGGQTITHAQNTFASAVDAGFYAALGSYGTTAWTFSVELLNDSSVLAHSSNLNYSSAMASYMVDAGGIAAPAGKAWASGGFTPGAVPEPNSALLMLIGCAALGLKRKRAKQA